MNGNNNSIDKERIKLKSLANGILKDYYNVNNLESVLDFIFSFSYSRAFKDFINDFEKLETIHSKGKYLIFRIPKDISRDIPQIKYALDVLFPTKLYYIIPKRFTGEIDILYYANLVEAALLIQSFLDEENNHKNVYTLAHKIMILLNDFDKDIPFNEPNKNYFTKLKNLKFDKNAKKLLKRTFKFFRMLVFYCCDQLLSENPNMNYPVIIGLFNATTLGSLIFLSGCSAVNNGRDVMCFDDVICAFETYFKFLNLINKD